MKENETKWYFAAKQYEKCDMAVKLGCTAWKRNIWSAPFNSLLRIWYILIESIKSILQMWIGIWLSTSHCIHTYTATWYWNLLTIILFPWIVSTKENLKT
jgi:hypothetical protein